MTVIVILIAILCVAPVPVLIMPSSLSSRCMFTLQKHYKNVILVLIFSSSPSRSSSCHQHHCHHVICSRCADKHLVFLAESPHNHKRRHHHVLYIHGGDILVLHFEDVSLCDWFAFLRVGTGNDWGGEAGGQGLPTYSVSMDRNQPMPGVVKAKCWCMFFFWSTTWVHAGLRLDF